MALRVKTVWFKKTGEQRDPTEVATVIASTIWRLCDGCIDNLSKANFDIITPQRGFRIIGEMATFLVHYVDRLAFNRMDDAHRQDVVSAVGVRLAEIMEENIIEFTGGQKDPDYDYQAGFIDLTNRRMGDYSAFDFPNEEASFAALRFLSLQIREVMEQSDQTWIQDQVMDIEMPQMMKTLKKSVDGFYPPQPEAAGQ